MVDVGLLVDGQANVGHRNVGLADGGQAVHQPDVGWDYFSLANVGQADQSDGC